MTCLLAKSEARRGRASTSPRTQAPMEKVLRRRIVGAGWYLQESEYPTRREGERGGEGVKKGSRG